MSAWTGQQLLEPEVMGSAVKIIKNIGVFLLIFYVLVLLLLYVLQGTLLFPAPSQPPVGLPENAEFFDMKTADGARLKHIRIPNQPGAPKVIFFHGNGSLAYYELDRGLELNRNGYDVLLAEYRGYGASTGSPSARKLLDDALETYDWFVEPAEDNVYLYAHSLGTGIATYLAAERNVEAVVLESPYSSTADLAASRYPIFPVRLLFKHDIPSQEHLKKVSVPVLMIHGERDDVIPIAYGRKLFESYQSESKEWLSLADAGHNNLLSFGTVAIASEFFKQH